MEAPPFPKKFPTTCSTSSLMSSLSPPTVSFLVPKSVRLTARASNPKTDQSNPSTNEPGLPFLPQEDLNFLVKLGAGSFAGGAAIKYASVIFPEITTPNISLALFMISAPVVVAVVLLFKQSRAVSEE